MSRSVVLLMASVAVCARGAETQGRSVAGVQKVIQMLQDMAAKAKAMKNEEEIEYAKFKTWCGLEQENLRTRISAEAQEISVLTASIEKLASDASVLGEQILQLGRDSTKFEGEKKTQTAQRTKDHAEFLTESQDYSESVNALERAIVVLQKQNYDRKGAEAALMQLSESEALPVNARSMIGAFVAMMGSDDDNDGGSGFLSQSSPEANAYEFKSGGVIDMLKRLADEFRSKKAQCEKEEMNSKHAYDMIVQDLTDSFENAQKDIEEKTAQKASKEEQAGAAKKELAATTSSKETDDRLLKDMVSECHQKGLSFEEKQELRGDEIEALTRAVEILSSTAISDASKHLALLQRPRAPHATSLAQLVGGASGHATGGAAAEGIRRKVREFLTEEAQRLHSASLGLLAQKVAADPFVKVRKLIEDMVTRLLAEANEDASHEGFCDKELGTNKVTREKLTEEIDSLDAAVEGGKAKITQLTQEIAELAAALAELAQARAEATALRAAEKEKNDATVADATAAQNALHAAIALLRDFYGTAAQATALLETSRASGPLLEEAARPKMGSEEWKALANPDYVTGGGSSTVDKGHKAGMQTFGSVNRGQQDEAGGVLALLDVILSDFAHVQATTEADEAAAQKEFSDFMAESAQTIAVKEKKKAR